MKGVEVGGVNGTVKDGGVRGAIKELFGVGIDMVEWKEFGFLSSVFSSSFKRIPNER